MADLSRNVGFSQVNCRHMMPLDYLGCRVTDTQSKFAVLIVETHPARPVSFYVFFAVEVNILGVVLWVHGYRVTRSVPMFSQHHISMCDHNLTAETQVSRYPPPPL